MEHVWAETALTPDGWQQSVLVTLDAGRIASVTADAPPQGTRVGCLLPAPANAHSHAFQRAMAGLTERRGPDPSDTFWTWRQLMFRFLDRITPEQVQAIAAFVQMEMLEAGYATNVEFHYLHHQPGGVPYARLSELSDRIAAAADLSGIGLTLLPAFYQTGGLDGRGLTSGQQRFGNDAERYARLAEEARARIATGPADWGFGIAPHSLRAAPAGALAEVVGLAPEGPIHMHLAEQKAEVEEVLAATGKRPVEWVLDTLAPDHRWHFIHCTQMEPHETEGLARSGATAVLCPLTEASLGDGIFDGIRWMGAGGRIAVGSDSNIRISLAEELRQLDTSQRLRDHSRAALATPASSTGRRLFDAVNQGGAGSAGRQTGALAAGNWADMLALDTTHPDLEEMTGDTILDSYIFAGDDRMVRDVWSAGRHMVHEGRHIHRDTIEAAYRVAVKELRAAP
ncbi:formimidoylglutamate deiminase [Nioella sediminis]|jgi:formimidoylglutamate deiminase|uniref:formimidoylglutamate deiminase n=1 Tax=Nioella sediminis TaxID=1912092 RepID=UPI0008FD2586|nr:formimidoylglutamate deiminase [Nioella sediminis]TBX21186.1 N-formimino-L-glutamate deiminase [Roseovarius sp. JS7-11]